MDGYVCFGKCERFTREQETELWQDWKAGDESARHRLIMSVVPWAIKQGLRVRRLGMDSEEAIELAVLHLIEKFDRFDPGRGRLTSYVGSFIGRSMWHEATNNQVIRIPATSTGREKCQHYIDAVKQGIVSLDVMRSAEHFAGSNSVGGLVHDEQFDDTLEKEKKALHEAIASLDFRDRTIIGYRMEGLTYDAIGKKVCLSKERVRQLLDRITDEIRVACGQQPHKRFKKCRRVFS